MTRSGWTLSLLGEKEVAMAQAALGTAEAVDSMLRMMWIQVVHDFLFYFNEEKLSSHSLDLENMDSWMVQGWKPRRA